MVVEILFELAQKRPPFLHGGLQFFRIGLARLFICLYHLSHLFCELAAILREREARVEELRMDLQNMFTNVSIRCTYGPTVHEKTYLENLGIRKHTLF